eukprot:TCONS_00070308-protein
MKSWLHTFIFVAVLHAQFGNVFGARKNHTNNWAVIACTSRYWFNYRHIANALSVYRSVKRLGIPDSHIILMLADEMPCNPRNSRPARVFNNVQQKIDVYGDNVEVDYKGYEVTPENLVRVLTGRVNENSPRSKRLLSDETSNILVYLTGHGGEGFLKFQEAEEITNIELADVFEQMWLKGRYNELLLLTDTCQAASIHAKCYSPNILAAASSQVGEDSLSHHDDPKIGVPIIDRWTYYILQFLEGVQPDSKKTMKEFFEQTSDYYLVRSHPHVRSDLFQRPLDKTLLTDFFGSVHSTEITKQYDFELETEEDKTSFTEDKININKQPSKKYSFVSQIPTL